MKVVLDSNIIIADFWLETTNFKLLFESAKKGDVMIYIPEVVLDEVVNKFSKRLEDSERKIDSELNAFNKLTREKEKNPLTKAMIDKSVSSYQKHLRKIVKDNSINVIKYPKTDHKFLANKAINKIKPFNSNEKGYRDCLIWENIKELLTDSESAVSQPELVFISNNYKDFATSEYELHPDLVSELEDEDYDSKSIIVYPSLSEFNDKQTKLFFAQSKSFEKKLKQKELWNFDLHTVITDYLFDKYVGSLNSFVWFDVVIRCAAKIFWGNRVLYESVFFTLSSCKVLAPVDNGIFSNFSLLLALLFAFGIASLFVRFSEQFS